MILKVQMPLNSSTRRVLIYNEDRSIIFQEPIANFAGLEQSLDGRIKAFFEAELVYRQPQPVYRQPNQIEIIFGKMLPDQGW